MNGEFGDFEDRPGGWAILDEPELRLGEDVLVPDIAGWRTENLPLLPAAAWFDVVPDWVCEALSQSTRDVDLGPKRNIYARDVVSHLRVVDPIARTLQAFELSGGNWALSPCLSGREHKFVLHSILKK